MGTADHPVIDGYCHCGLTKFVPLEDVQATMHESGVDRAVLVQHLGEFDNSYLATIVRDHSNIYRAVALVDADNPSWPRDLAELAASGYVKGLRVARETLLDEPQVCRAAADHGLVLMIDVTPSGIDECIPALEILLRRETPGVVISHLGYPRIEDGTLVAGRELLGLAQFPDVRVLLSGTAMWPEEASGALDDLTHEIIDAFGASRLMWGSNYPPCGGGEGLRRDLERIRSDRWGLAPAEIESITHGNAEELWFA